MKLVKTNVETILKYLFICYLKYISIDRQINNNERVGKRFCNTAIRLNLIKSCPELFRDLDIQVILKSTRKKYQAGFSSSNVACNKRCASHFNSYDFHATCFCILFQEVQLFMCSVTYGCCTKWQFLPKLNKYWQI